jgi:CheY-like chemotaxis protein
MSRILLADDSPHAQRIGECILREEGFEVVTVTDGDTALVRLTDVDPDVVLASVLLPRRNGYEICRYVKEHVRQRHTRVVLTAGALDPLDEEEARKVQADGSLRKPFEATLLLQTLKPLVEAAQREREQSASIAGEALAQPDPERVRAAVTLALDSAFPALVEEITRRVVNSLKA